MNKGKMSSQILRTIQSLKRWAELCQAQFKLRLAMLPIVNHSHSQANLPGQLELEAKLGHMIYSKSVIRPVEPVCAISTVQAWCMPHLLMETHKLTQFGSEQKCQTC